MLRDHSRKKLIQTIVYLARDTQALGKTKLFTLLCLIDFEHFRQTGRSVTGMVYRAWEMGPVPFKLMQEWDHPKQDFTAALEIRPEPVFDYERDRITALVPFNPGNFSRRELRIVKDVADQYRDAPPWKMTDVTRAENGAWGKAWNYGAGNDEVIDYQLAVADDDPHRKAILTGRRRASSDLLRST